ncbi:MAG: hypothetical protein Q8K89_05600, partial [Actinomycetota bacterium]|nr:hypothetical protein [Actinomycetota bacterium]
MPAKGVIEVVIFRRPGFREWALSRDENRTALCPEPALLVCALSNRAHGGKRRVSPTSGWRDCLAGGSFRQLAVFGVALTSVTSWRNLGSLDSID